MPGAELGRGDLLEAYLEKKERLKAAGRPGPEVEKVLQGRPMGTDAPMQLRGTEGEVEHRTGMPDRLKNGMAVGLAHSFARLQPVPAPATVFDQSAIQLRKVSDDSVLDGDILDACKKYKPTETDGMYQKVLLSIAENNRCEDVNTSTGVTKLEVKLKTDSVLDDEDLKYIQVAWKAITDKWIKEQPLYMVVGDIWDACEKLKPDSIDGFYKKILLHIADNFDCTGVSTQSSTNDIEQKLKDDNALDDEGIAHLGSKWKAITRQWIQMNEMPIGTILTSMNKNTAASKLPKDIGNGTRVVGEMINHPTSGGTGFTALGKTVYHNSSGSSSAGSPGTVFWVYDGDETLTVVAMGQHYEDASDNDEYLINWTCNSVSVQTTHQTKNRVKLNSTTDKLK